MRKSLFYSLLMAYALCLCSTPLSAWGDWDFGDGCCDCCDIDWCSMDFGFEGRVAYFHPSSKRVRRIYSDGWADYQFEASLGLPCNFDLCGGNFRLWTGVSGFSKGGHAHLEEGCRCFQSEKYSGRSCESSKHSSKFSSGCFNEISSGCSNENSSGCSNEISSGCSDSQSFNLCHNSTNLDLIPVYFGIKYFYPIACCTSVYVGGGGCYSFLRIKDHSRFVHKHIRKEEWGGVVQAGVHYNLTECFYLCAFFDYFFQTFHFSNHHRHSSSDSRHRDSCSSDRRRSDSCRSYVNNECSYQRCSPFVERNDLDMSGFKVGGGIGLIF